MRFRFMDRVRELEILEKEFRGSGLRLVIVYGRRRVGKTYLLNYFSRGKDAVFFTAIEASKNVLYRELSRAISEWLGKPIGVLESIEDVLELIYREARERVVVVLDEFQHLVEADPETLSRLQRFIDTHPDADLMIVICGSAVSFFERELLGYRSPLFGRRTASIKLKPMRLLDVWGFYPRYNALEAIYAYSAFGGTPAYARYVDDEKSVFINIAEKILSRGSYLYDEAINFFRQEVREPSTYIAILSAIASGYTKPSEVASIAGITSKSISRYIELLENLDIVERIRSLGRKRGEVQLEIVDPYFHFWFRYVKPRFSQLEQGYTYEVLGEVKKSFDTYVARVVEMLIRRELVYELLSRRLIESEMGIVGKWWYRGEEIDVVVQGETKTLFIEVKWSDLDLREAMAIARDLEARASVSGLQKSSNLYLVIARSVERCRPICRDGPYAAVDLLNLLTYLRSTNSP